MDTFKPSARLLNQRRKGFILFKFAGSLDNFIALVNAQEMMNFSLLWNGYRKLTTFRGAQNYQLGVTFTLYSVEWFINQSNYENNLFQHGR